MPGTWDLLQGPRPNPRYVARRAWCVYPLAWSSVWELRVDFSLSLRVCAVPVSCGDEPCICTRCTLCFALPLVPYPLPSHITVCRLFLRVWWPLLAVVHFIFSVGIVVVVVANVDAGWSVYRTRKVRRHMTPSRHIRAALAVCYVPSRCGTRSDL